MWHEALQTLGPIHLKLYIHKIIYFPKPVSHIKHVTQSPQTVYQIYLKCTYFKIIYLAKPATHFK